jgi:hypothetical protein
MNSWSNRMNQVIQHKFLITLIFGLIFLVPLIATAQEVTEEPQVETVATEEAVEQPTDVPTEEATEVETEVAPTEEVTEAAPEATEPPPETPVVEETVVDVEATEEVVIETTEEATVEVIEPEETPDESETIVVEETPVDLTSFSDDFEYWTGNNWSVTDWSVVQGEDSLVLFGNIASATAQVINLDWTDYAINIDAKVEAGNTLAMTFDGYTLILASDSRNRLSKDGEVVATSPAIENPDDTITWHHVRIVKGGAALTVTVDNIPQYTVAIDNSPLGIFAFTATSDQGVSIDNLMMAELDESDPQIIDVISTPTPEAEVIEVEVIDNPEATEEPDLLAETTEEPDLLAEVTEEPDILAEVTEEPDILAEVTEEPDLLAEVTEEPDILAEATEEPVVSVVEEPVYVVTNIITEDFEGDLSLWNTTASIVEIADGNHVLLTSADGQLSPISSTTASGVVVGGQSNIMADVETAGSFTVTLSETYAVEISTTGIKITENGEIVTEVESAQALNTWFAFSIEAKPEGIAVSISDAVIAEYTGTLVLEGNFAIGFNTNTMFEDITVDTLTLEAVDEPLATETPEIISEAALKKLGGVADDLIETFLEGGDDAVAEFLASSSDPQDEFGRVLVDILASNNYDGATIAQLVTDAGGDVTRIYEQSIEAYIDVNVIIAVTHNEGIRFIRDVQRAVSTGPTGPVGTLGDYEAWTEGYNLLSIEEWNLAGVDGDGVKIGVVDTGFKGADTTLDGNIPCVVDGNSEIAEINPVYTPDDPDKLFDSAMPNVVRDHGTQIIEVICDIAPASDVYMFRADDASSLQEAIMAARGADMNVLLITLDLGANTSAGGGLSGTVNTNVYAEIEAAKNDGMVVIVAAGNNNLRTLVVEIPAGETDAIEIDLELTEGDKIKFGWNDFGDNATVVADIDVVLDIDGFGGSNDDDGDSDDPLLNPLSLTAPADGTATLTITPTNNGTETTYLQVQISPVVVNNESFSTVFQVNSAENDVKFDYGTFTTSGTATDISDTVGNLGRPADSDHVISVGAICTRTGQNPARWEFSSNGPRFKPDGSPLDNTWDDNITQEEAKPSIMSYSFVTTNGSDESNPEGDIGELLTCTEGLGGTSASAAHVAGMAALLMSNDDNSSFDEMNAANATDADTFNAIRDYLQGRSIDLPLGEDADGFDAIYGAGVSILGAPTYDLDDTVNLNTVPDNLPETCVGSTYYVGQADMGDTAIDGGLSSPFISIGEALNASSPECIIVMPGEYVTPIFVEKDYTEPLLVTGYNDVSRGEFGDVILWIRGLYYNDSDYEYSPNTNGVINYRRRAGVYFGDSSANVEFSGFTFVAARFFTDEGDITDENDNGSSNTSAPQAVIMDGSTDTTVSNSQFGKITINGVEYPGWDDIDGTPIQILNEAEGARIENNVFNDNTTSTRNFYPTLAVINSGVMDNPITIIGNEIFGNSGDDPLQGNWGSVLYSDGSHIDIINNAIHDNVGETIIEIETTAPTDDEASTGISGTHTRRARIVGNVFLNNSTTSTLDPAGPIINGYYAPMIYIINNTMVSNTVPSTQPFGQFFGRGDANLDNEGSIPGSTLSGQAFWEIHNNLIFNNTYRELVGDARYDTTTPAGCNRIPNDSSDTDLYAFAWDHTEGFAESDDGSGTFIDRGAQNNWIVSNNNTEIGGGEFGDCVDAIFTLKNVTGTVARNNQNIVDDDNQPVDSRQVLNDDSPLARDGDFQGILTPDEEADPDFVPTHDVNDWQYYAITDTLISEDNSDENEYSDGIDAADETWLSDTGGGDAGDPYMDNADIEFDILATKRQLDVNNWQINWLTGWNPISSTVSIPQGVSHTDDAEFIVDIGAFEFSPLQFEFNCDVVDCEYYDADLEIPTDGDPIPAVTDGMLEDSDEITFDFSPLVTGGFGELTFSINSHPSNYGTQCDDKFENTKGLVIQGNGYNELFDYCPPPNFYTSTGNSAPDYVSFEVTVRDEAGAVSTGEVRFTIDAVDDGDLPSTAVIGVDAPSATTFEVISTLGSNPSVRLRPYVRFDNFFFSENDNPDFILADELFVDYPFSYEITDIDDSADLILEGTFVDGYTVDLDEDPIINLQLSDSNTGEAIITYRITDGRGNISNGNKLIIKSVSIIPDEGLHDDTSFIWNYSDATNAAFYTQRVDHNSTNVPNSGDWQVERSLGAINDTLHTTSTTGDTASFRFIGTGFTVFMQGGSSSGGTFEINIYDQISGSTDEVDVTAVKNWVTSTSAVNEVTIDLVDDVNDNANLTDDELTCTTLADVDSVDQNLLVHSLSEYSITCDGLPARKHSVQIVNTGGGTLSVDAFSIIHDTDLDFTDPEPIPPGFHDIDNAVLRNAFNDIHWDEALPDTGYSNSVALIHNTGSEPTISFTITRASGFAIGTTYRNDSSDFNICVENQDLASDGVCSIVKDNIGSTEDGVRIPFFGLNPDHDYTVTLENLSAGFIFDDLIVFSELLLPVASLPLGTTHYSDLDLTLGEPFNDDWTESGDVQVINEDRSPIGPFISFQMDDNIDTIGIKAENVATGPACTPSRKVVCPPPPPQGFSGLAVCVNRGNEADNSGTNYGNCIIVDTYDKPDTESNTFDYVDSSSGDIILLGGSISNPDGMIVIDESLFDTGWGSNGNGEAIVEIFSLHPDSDFEFESVTLYSSADGLGEGSYTVNSSGIFYLEYDHSDNSYTDVPIDNDGENSAFKTIELKQCLKEKKGVCLDEITVGTYMGTTGVGNAILFKMQGTGIIPRFTESAGTFARVCIMDDSEVTDQTSAKTIAEEIRLEALLDGGCEILDLTGSSSNSARYINGIKNTTQHVMIELLPSPTNATPSLNFNGLNINGGDLDGLDPIPVGDVYETSYTNRKDDDNMFLYTGSWQTKADTDGTHLGTTYDQTDKDNGASISFKTTGGNVVNIIRDLKTNTEEVCTGKGKRAICIPSVNGYTDITVCVAPEDNTGDRHCSVHTSDGDATQSVLPISLNSTFDNSTDYVVSVTASNSGFAIDAVEVLDTTLDKMTVGIYQEDSSLIAYENGQTEVLRNTSFENTPLLDGGSSEDWDWNIDGVNATIVTDNPFIGSNSLQLDGNENDSVLSETFDIVEGISYTAVARVYVISGTAEMRSDITGFEAQSTQSTGKWEYLRYGFSVSTPDTVQLEFAAAEDDTSFYIDDVHVFKGGAWNFGTDIATSNGYSSQASFMFTGTGFTVKLDSDTSSGETQVCYDNGSGKHCFTYDNEQELTANVVCSAKEISKGTCPTIPVPEANIGHTVVGLDSDDYLVTIQQLDNGRRTYAIPPECSTKSYSKGNCPASSGGNILKTSPSTVKLDYIQIYDDAQPPVLVAGIYNEDALISSDLGMQLFPTDEWEQITGASGFTSQSYYQVNDSQTVGSTLILNVDNTESATLVIDMNQTTTGADQILVCGDDVDGAVEFNGTGYDITSDSCTLTDQATNQKQLVFNESNLPALDGSGGEVIVSLRSLTKDRITIDGYQVIYGTTLIEGYYEEIIGHGISGTNSILTISDADWDLNSNSEFSGLKALETDDDGATIDFTFEGTGVSILMQTPNIGTLNGLVTVDISHPTLCGGSCLDDFDAIIDTTDIAAVDGAITIAGLPYETYDVTLTTTIVELDGEEVIIDAIEILGDLQELGSLYDDAQVDVNGTPLLTFGQLWTATTDDTSGKFLNNTFHSSSNLGASVSFLVSGTTPTEGIVIFDGNPTTASTDVEVCWSSISGTSLDQSCTSVDLDIDGTAATSVDFGDAGNYSVSITNQANGEPLVIDAIQVLEEDLMTEGIYEETFGQFNEVAADVANDDAGNGFAIQVTSATPLTFTFEGVAFSALILDNSTLNDVDVSSSTDFSVCVYEGVEVADECTIGSPDIDDDYGKTDNTVSAVSYAGFHSDSTGTDNGEWTVVITNNDATNPLLIDRIDILGNKNDLEITDGGVYEAGQPQIRYLPFGSWTEQTSFKDGSPLNNARFETTIPGAIAYFEYDDNFNNTDAGFEYVRQIQDTYTPEPICTKFKKGVCSSSIPQPTEPAYADANVCYGTVGTPNPMGCDLIDNDTARVFQFSSGDNADDCDGCWGFVQYDRDALSDSLTPLDFVRLYDPTSTLTAGVYQENHPNINVSGTATSIADDDAKVGFFSSISNTSGESSFDFTFTGTGLSIRTFAGADAEDIDICIIDYTGGAVPSHTDPSTCLRTYDNQQTTDGFVTRALHGLHPDAEYMAIIKMTSDGTTQMGLDQVTIFDNQWFDESDLDDATYLHQLEDSYSYPIDFKTRNSDKLVQFLGDWESVSEQIFVRYENEKKQRDPIYITESGDRALEPSATALFRVSGSNAVTVDIELGDSGDFQICSIPMIDNSGFEVEITAGATCKIFTQDGRSLVSFVFNDNLSPQVMTIELLTDTWMSLYNIQLFDVTNGLGTGLYDNSAPGILYDSTFEKIIDEDMENTVAEATDWTTIGTPISNTRAGLKQICLKERNGVCSSYQTTNEPHYEGTYSRKLIANIGQGIQYIASGSGVSLDTDTFYTAIARVYLDPATSGGVEMRLISGTESIEEVEELNLSTTTRGTWQTIRADFYTEQAYDELILQIAAINGQTTFYVDDITLTTGGQWTNATPPIGPDICTGSGRKVVCVPGDVVFEAYGDNFTKSITPGASFTFDFVGTGFELGLIGGNKTGDVEVCYSNEVDFANPSCFTYSQDDGAIPISTVCLKEKKGICLQSKSSKNDTTNLLGRGIVGLENDTWIVRVRDVDNGYNHSSPTKSREIGIETCLREKKGVCTQTAVTPLFSDATMGIDYLYIYEDTDLVTIPAGFYNEDAQNDSEENYLAVYPEASWQSFSGLSAFSQKTYVAPTLDSLASSTPGPVALLQIDVDEGDEGTAVVFQLGGASTGIADVLMMCVDETNGKMEWDGTQFNLVDSENCMLFNDVGASQQVSLTNDDIAALEDPGLHNITVTALTSGLFRIDDFQVFDSRALAAGLHQESLPTTILILQPEDLDTDSTCDPMDGWCSQKTKVVMQDVCTKYKGDVCRSSELQPVTISPYLGSAAVASHSGASANFVARGTGFSIISDVHENGLDFRVCYKLESSGTAFPTVGSNDEDLALNGYEEGTELPVLISEGGILCENLTTDTDNWNTVMDRPAGSGEQYGFSFYGLPLGTYEIQVMVTDDDISGDEWFALDAINVFSDSKVLETLEPGLTDDANANISYEPSVFWEANATSNTYEKTDSTTDHAGAISQFTVNGNTLAIYQTMGDMSPDVQICLLISNENIHCSVEAERQSRLARQVTSFTQVGDLVPGIVCIKFKKDRCTATAPALVQETTVFTPIVFYGLGEDDHTIIMENRVQGETFNIDALRVLE